MASPNVLDRLGVDRPPVPGTDIARRGDPASSHGAARELTTTGRRRSQNDLAVALVRAHPGATCDELAAFTDWSREKLAKRLSDCAGRGFLRQGEARHCRVKGRLEVTWWLPVEPEGQRALFGLATGVPA